MVTLILGILLLLFGIALRLDKTRSAQQLARLWEDLSAFVLGWGSIAVGGFCTLLGLYFVTSGHSSGSVLPQLYIGLGLVAIGALLMGVWKFLLSDKNDPTTNFTFAVFGIPFLMAAGASSVVIGALLSIASLLALAVSYLFG